MKQLVCSNRKYHENFSFLKQNYSLNESTTHSRGKLAVRPTLLQYTYFTRKFTSLTMFPVTFCCMFSVAQERDNFFNKYFKAIRLHDNFSVLEVLILKLVKCIKKFLYYLNIYQYYDITRSTKKVNMMSHSNVDVTRTEMFISNVSFR